MQFFAEGIPRLGVINLSIQLHSKSDHSTSIITTAGLPEVIVNHGGSSSTLILPLAPSSSQTSTYSLGSSTITSRIYTIASASSEIVPLLSADIFKERSKEVNLCCSTCHHPILSSHQIKWKDLPSDSWLEYSDYWLCHPHSHSHNHNHEDTSPDLTIPSILKVNKDTILIGLTFLLINPSDLQNITFKVRAFFSPLDLKKVSLCE
jgi:HECT-like Ubiquitin-conjugating enzyme (E2)-binding